MASYLNNIQALRIKDLQLEIESKYKIGGLKGAEKIILPQRLRSS